MAAIKSLQTLADIMEVIDLENYFIPFIASLTMNDRSTKRLSVSHLFTSVYMRVSPKHQSKCCLVFNIKILYIFYIIIVLL